MLQSSSAALTSHLLAAIETVRREPQGAIVTRLRARLSRFKGNDYSDPNRHNAVIVKKEGKVAVQEAINFLLRQKALEFDSSPSFEGLKLAAADHCIDIGMSGNVGHSGRDGSSPSARMERYGSWHVANGECLWFGRLFVTDPDSSDPRLLREQANVIIDDLIIDDGVPDRGHRLCIYTDHYLKGGAHVGPHSIFGSVACIEFVGDWEERAESEGAVDRITERTARLAILSTSDAGAPRTQWSGALGKCVGCHLPIIGGAVITAEKIGGRLHEQCFVCGCSSSSAETTGGEYCGKSLRGATHMVVKDGADGSRCCCKACWERLHAVECQRCKQRIIDGKIARDKGGTEDFHLECYQSRSKERSAAAAAAAAKVGSAPQQRLAAATGKVVAAKVALPGELERIGLAGFARLVAQTHVSKDGSKALTKNKKK